MWAGNGSRNGINGTTPRNYQIDYQVILPWYLGAKLYKLFIKDNEKNYVLDFLPFTCIFCHHLITNKAIRALNQNRVKCGHEGKYSFSFKQP